jgi:(+)-neomenthol dehydrogenase
MDVPIGLFLAVSLCFGLSEPVIKSNFGCTKFSMNVNQRFEWMKLNSKETYEEAVQCMETICYGAKIVRGTAFCLSLLQLSSFGIIVNVSSGFGLLRVSFVNLNKIR